MKPHFIGSCDCIECISALKCGICGRKLINKQLFEAHQLWKHNKSNTPRGTGLDEFLRDD